MQYQPLLSRFEEKYHLVILVFITLIAIWLRFNGLVFQSYWNDELATIVISNPENNLPNVIFSALTDNSPPLYQTLLWYWFQLFGFTEYAGRSFSALVGSLSVVAMYFLAKEFINSRAALIASLLVCINYSAIYYSQEVRNYELLFLTTILSLLFLSRLLRIKNKRELILYTIFSVCLVQTHYFGTLAYLAQLSLMFMSFRIFPNKYILINASVTFISLLPTLPFMVIKALDKSFWIKAPGPDYLLKYFTSYFGDKELSVIAGLLFFSGFFYLLKNKDARHKNLVFLVLSSLVFIYIVPYIRSLNSTPMLIGKYTVSGLPLIILLSTAGIESIKSKYIKITTVVLLIVFSAYILIFEKDYYNTIIKHQYREAILTVQNMGDGELVYTCKDDRVDAYYKMLGYRSPIRDYDALMLMLNDPSQKDHFWIIDGMCCGCSEWRDINHQLINKRGLNQLENIKKKSMQIFRYAKQSN